MFCKSIIRNFKQILLYSVSVGVGVTSVLTVTTLSNFGINSAKTTLDSMGLNGYILSHSQLSDDAYLKMCTSSVVKYAAPLISIDANINGDKVSMLGTDSNIQKLYSIATLYGDFINSKNVLNGDAVCVISSNCSNKFFSNENGVGNRFNAVIDGFAITFTVCGIYKSDPIINGYAQEIAMERIYVPYTTVKNLSNSQVNSIALIPYNDSFPAIKAYAQSILGNNCIIKNIASDRAKIEMVMNVLKTVLSIIGSLTLAVSTVSLTIIMVINVRNSRGEIGIKKSIGATDLKILLEVIAQSIIISLIGYATGIVIYSVILLFSRLLSYQLIFDIKTAFISLLVLIVSSALAGIIPGIIAAKTRPAIIMRE